jgi:hypothetical protein
MTSSPGTLELSEIGKAYSKSNAYNNVVGKPERKRPLLGLP